MAVLPAFFVSCEKNAKDPESAPVAFTSFGFYADDNSGIISQDIVQTEIKASDTKLNFTFPIGTDDESLKSLVARFEVNGECTVTCDGKTVESGKTVLDFSKNIDFQLSNGKDNALYTVSVKILELSLIKVAESEQLINAECAMTINPKDNLPYIFGTLSNDDSSLKFPNLFKVDGTSLVSVAGNLVEAYADYFGLNFTPDGIPYVIFSDKTEEGAGKMSVMKIENGKASYVGAPGALFKPAGNTVSSATVIPISANNVYAAHYNNSSDAPSGRRSINVAHFDGSNWTNGVQLPDRELSEQGWVVISKIVRGVPYMYILNFNKISVSIFKYEDNSWKNVFGEIKPIASDGSTALTTAGYKYTTHDFDVDREGNVYILIQADFFKPGMKQLTLVKVSLSDKSQTIIGGPITKEDISDSRYVSVSLDGNDVPFITYTTSIDSNNGYITYLDQKTKDWATPYLVSSSIVTGLNCKYADDGTMYIGYLDNNTHKYIIMQVAK